MPYQEAMPVCGSGFGSTGAASSGASDEAAVGSATGIEGATAESAGIRGFTASGAMADDICALSTDGVRGALPQPTSSSAASAAASTPWNPGRDGMTMARP